MAKTCSKMFFRSILVPHLNKDGALELPEGFVKENWESFTKKAYLEVPTGAKSEMRLKKRDGRARLQQGWHDFVEKYSIKRWYLIMFEYQGRSNFSVRICDWTTQEIVYEEADFDAKKEEEEEEDCPTENKSCHPKEADSDTKEEEEEDCSTEVDSDTKEEEDDCPAESDCEMEMDNQSESADEDEDCPTESDNDSEKEMENQSGKSESRRKSSSVEDNNQRSKELRSRNHHFSVVMRPAYVTSRGASYMHIPSHGASYFGKNGKDDIELSLNGRIWCMKYYVGSSSCSARIGSGWKKFSEENNLKEGDECTFQPISTTDMKFKVTIVRQKGTKKPENVERIRKRKRDSCAKEETSFTVTLTKTNVGRLRTAWRLNIPRAHSARHLLDQHRNEIVFHGDGGQTWRVTCFVYGLDAKILTGWKDFVVGNGLQVGDTCYFELCSTNPNRYNVIITRDGAGSSSSSVSS